MNEEFQIKVRLLQGTEEKMVKVREMETIANLKSKLSSVMNVPIQQQRLIYQGWILTDNQTIKDSKIKPDTIV